MVARLSTSRLALTASLISSLVLSTSALISAQTGYIYAAGAPTFTTPSQVEMGFVNLANGNLHLEVPILSLPQRGSLRYTAKLVYDSRIWVPSGGVWSPTNVAGSQGGWRFVTTADGGAVTYGFMQDDCDGNNHFKDTYGPFYWTDTSGAVHMFNITTIAISPLCGGGGTSTGDAFASDSSGYHMHVSLNTAATVYAKDGTVVRAPTSASFVQKDTNGNFFTKDANGNIVDTLNRTPFTVSTNGSQTTYTTKNSQNVSENYVVTTTSVNYFTNFVQSGVTNSSGSFTAIQTIALPDGTNYQFTYDSGTTLGHYGELTSMTLPSGGTINYTYTKFTDAAAAQNEWLNTRAYGGGTWTYAPATATSGCQSGNAGCQKVTLTKPSNDQTVYTFSLFGGGAWNTQTQYNTGASTLLKTVSNTYDFLHSTNVVLTQTVETMPIPGSVNVSKQTTYGYDSSTTTANINVVKEWNLYTGTPGASPDRETDTVYQTSTNYTGIYINNRPTIQ